MICLMQILKEKNWPSQFGLKANNAGTRSEILSLSNDGSGAGILMLFRD